MVMKLMASRENLQLNMGSEPQWVPYIPHIYKVLNFPEVRDGKGMWKSLHQIQS